MTISTTNNASEAEPAMLELVDIHRQFGQQPVLRDVNLWVERGETVCVIGESGCGKSVTLRLLCGLISPTNGGAFLQGKSWSDLSEAEMARARLRFGFLFQGAALFDSLNVFENVAFGLRQNVRLPEEQLVGIIRERLNEVGLPFSVCEKKPAQLSGGMRKRVALARALAMSPEIMLYDEPTTGLDPVMIDVINELILQTRTRWPITSVVVTHEMSTVRKVADRVVMLHPVSRLAEGEPQVIFNGTPELAFDSPDPRVRNFMRGVAGDRFTESLVA